MKPIPRNILNALKDIKAWEHPGDCSFDDYFNLHDKMQKDICEKYGVDLTEVKHIRLELYRKATKRGMTCYK